MTEHELRRSPRQRVAAIAALRMDGLLNPCDQGIASVFDMSRCGIGLQTGQPPMLGQSVHLRISLDDVIHEVSARATRVDSDPLTHFYRVGLDWNASSEVELRFLDNVLEVADSLTT